MALIRVTNYVDAYRLRSKATDLHNLAARDGREAITDFVSSKILERLVPESKTVLVDVGCGDGCLLRKAADVTTRIGTVGSQDERDRLHEEMPDINFKVGLAQDLPLETASADKIVCNAVLMYLLSEKEVIRALLELSRIAKPGAVLWIGELPAVDEYSKFKIYVGDSVPGLLWHCLSEHGTRTFLGMCRKLLKTILGREQMALNAAGLYYASPESFIALAQSCGLRLDAYFKHRELDVSGKIIDSLYRFDYVFRK